MLASLPPDEVAVFQDEVQLDLNPKIGSAWMLKGFQAEVVTPGDNDRRHLAASVVAGSGTLVVSGRPGGGTPTSSSPTWPTCAADCGGGG